VHEPPPKLSRSDEQDGTADDLRKAGKGQPSRTGRKHRKQKRSGKLASPENELRGNNNDLATSSEGQVLASSGVAECVAILLTR
jgi:hypothetical protein